MDKKELKQILMSKGHVKMDEDGKCVFTVCQINDTNFNDIGDALRQQLVDERKYDTWISFIAYTECPPYSVQMLPIYGNSQKYVTKWFATTKEESIEQGFKDKQMGLLNRVNNYARMQCQKEGQSMIVRVQTAVKQAVSDCGHFNNERVAHAIVDNLKGYGIELYEPRDQGNAVWDFINEILDCDEDTGISSTDELTIALIGFVYCMVKTEKID
jgi:hypothetical protein